MRLAVDDVFGHAFRLTRWADRPGTIPIIAITDDMVGAGLVANLSRPGANLTGLTILSPELSAKRLEVLKSVFPAITRVATLTDPTTGTAQVLLTRNAAQFLNVDLYVLEVRGREQLRGAFEAAKAQGAEAFNVFSSPLLSSLDREIIALRRNTSCRRSISGGNTQKREGLFRMGPTSPRCGDSAGSWWPRFWRVPLLATCR